jgi:hypothetical protein
MRQSAAKPIFPTGFKALGERRGEAFPHWTAQLGRVPRPAGRVIAELGVHFMPTADDSGEPG